MSSNGFGWTERDAPHLYSPAHAAIFTTSSLVSRQYSLGALRTLQKLDVKKARCWNCTRCKRPLARIPRRDLTITVSGLNRAWLIHIGNSIQQSCNWRPSSDWSPVQPFCVPAFCNANVLFPLFNPFMPIELPIRYHPAVENHSVWVHNKETSPGQVWPKTL